MGLLNSIAQAGRSIDRMMFGNERIGTPRTGRFAQADAEATEAFGPLLWRVVLSTTVGASHVASGAPNQDAITLRTVQERRSPEEGGVYATSVSPPFALSIADGHGGKKHFRSQEGARIAVAVATEVLLGLADPEPATLEEFSRRIVVAREHIVRQWQRDVRLHHANHASLHTDGLVQDEGDADSDASSAGSTRYDEETSASDGAADPLSQQLSQGDEHAGRRDSHAVKRPGKSANELLVPYGTTVLALLVTNQFCAVLQLGDGGIALVTRNDGGSSSENENDGAASKLSRITAESMLDSVDESGFSNPTDVTVSDGSPSETSPPAWRALGEEAPAPPVRSPRVKRAFASIEGRSSFETDSLCMGEKAQGLMQVGILDRAPLLALLATDGFEGAYASDQAFLDTALSYHDHLSDGRGAEVERLLPSWLRDISAQATGDDTTLALAYPLEDGVSPTGSPIPQT